MNILQLFFATNQIRGNLNSVIISLHSIILTDKVDKSNIYRNMSFSVNTFLRLVFENSALNRLGLGPIQED